MYKILFLTSALLISCFAKASTKPENINAYLDSLFQLGINEYEFAGIIVSIVRDDTVVFEGGYGFQDLENKIKADPYKSIFRLGSIAKNMTALAVMQLYERGLVDLDKDINLYLKSYQVKSRYESPITIRQLLTHTSGIDDYLFSAQARSAEERQPLAVHINDRFPAQVRPAGIYTYASYGPGILSLLVEDIAGMPFYQYVEENIFNPLAMQQTSFFKKKDLQSHYAKSYIHMNGEFKPYTDEPHIHIYAAGSAMSSAHDMGNYMRMYLGGGTFQQNNIINAETLKTMTQSIEGPFADFHSGVSLGFFNTTSNGHHVIDHSGAIQGFKALMNLYPEAGLGIFIAFNSGPYQTADASMARKYGNLIISSIENIFLSEKSIKKPAITDAEDPLRESYAGIYRDTRYSNLLFEKIGVLLGLSPEQKLLYSNNQIIIAPNDTLQYIGGQRYWSEKLSHPVAFSKNLGGKDYLFLETNSFEKLDWYESNAFQFNWIGIILISQLLFLLVFLILKLIKSKRQLLHGKGWSLSAINAFFILMFMIILIGTLFSREPQEFIYGTPFILKANLVLPFLIIGLLVLNIYIIFQESRKKHRTWGNTIFNMAFWLIQLSFIFWIDYWNLLGFKY